MNTPRRATSSTITPHSSTAREPQPGARAARRSLVALATVLATGLACQLSPPASAVAASGSVEFSTSSTDTSEYANIRVVPESVATTYGDPYPEYQIHLEGELDKVHDALEVMILAMAKEYLRGPEPHAPAGGHGLYFDGTPPVAYANAWLSWERGVHRIDEAPLTVEVDDMVTTYGDPTPKPSVRMLGLKSGDTPADITGVHVTMPSVPWPFGLDANIDPGYPVEVSVDPQNNYRVTAVKGYWQIQRAPLALQADNVEMTWGNPIPAPGYSITGWVNAENEGVLGRPTFRVPHRPAVGEHVLSASGHYWYNYVINQTGGRLTVHPRPVTITVHDYEMTYGEPDPGPQVTIEGLPGDIEDSERPRYDVVLEGTDRAVGEHQVTVVPRDNPNFVVTVVPGTVTVNRASMVIRADDIRFGSGEPVPEVTWTPVVKEGHVLLHEHLSEPTCTATIDAVPVTSELGPGSYPGATSCAGADYRNFDIAYDNGSVTVDPRLGVEVLGLPEAAQATVTLGQDPLALSTSSSGSRVGSRVVPLGSRQQLSLAPVVIHAGQVLMTPAHTFDGEVSANIVLTRRYAAMAPIIDSAFRAGAITPAARTQLLDAWSAVETAVLAADAESARLNLKAFATVVRSKWSQGVQAAAGTTIMTHAQAVWLHAGGEGEL